MTETTHQTDPYTWLEDIHSPEALDWVRERNSATEAWLHTPAFEALEASLLEALDAEDRIPGVVKRGEFYYNFWRDAENPKGLWRRTSWDSYLRDDPDWEILLDVDALAAAEGTDWMYAGVTMLRPAPGQEYRRALVKLSPDGGDAVRIREYDVVDRAFVAPAVGGFDVPVAKSSLSWAGPDAIYLATDFGPDADGQPTVTKSSYARTVRRLERGVDPADAPEVFSVSADHVMAVVSRDSTPGFERSFAFDMIDFHHSRAHVEVDGEWRLIDVPTDVDVDVHRQWVLFSPRTDWDAAGTLVPAGSLAVAELDAYLAGEHAVRVVFTPDERTSLQSYAFTRDYLVLMVLRDVVSAVLVASPAGDWELTELDAGGSLETVAVGVVDDEDEHAGNDLWFTRTGFTTPSTLMRGTLGVGGGAPALSGLTAVKRAVERFEADGLSVEQHFATSDDGTAVPYFQVGPADLALDGANPTLMNGYGGFQISLTPSYSAAVGRAWLTRRNDDGRTGVYVVANIRGGGEYGPRWHQAALKANRHRAYEDFAAIARDLVSRGVTSPEHLAASGGSNGGLLMGNMMTGYPELFGAISCGVPLLDMRRYTQLSAGHSWIAEYGDPDVPEEWDFVRTFSPLHRLDEMDAEAVFPASLIWTATSDDRVGPVQARKMYAKMSDRGAANVWYHEDLEGGHAGATDNRQTARKQATSYEFLWRHVAG
ncbi:prolyl oligopeptidase family serine peptidase [Zhihengliuella halotolerans]|uniref:Prolyl oligopeptidase n=1 Tax=Zhihengliuella halotolerans TaxID=370736 RepID=A0A4Q8AAK1_9MICC|nr:prolyl oligopeptidase family serine peptidase [Zhihengliuella halotolerans]RZU60543.1 prolyl oligopeptidase [Zhihengliuella halotolerans]